MKKDSLKDFISLERVLDRVVRFSTHTRIRDQSISEHSYHVALYAMLLADLEESFGNKVDKTKLLKTALLHDLEESMTGDIIYSFKHGDERLLREIRRLSSDFFKELIDKLPPEIAKEYFELWKNSKDMNTIEGRIIEAADKLEGLMYSIEEFSLGNKRFEIIIERYVEEIKKINLKSVKFFLEQII